MNAVDELDIEESSAGREGRSGRRCRRERTEGDDVAIGVVEAGRSQVKARVQEGAESTLIGDEAFRDEVEIAGEMEECNCRQGDEDVVLNVLVDSIGDSNGARNRGPRCELAGGSEEQPPVGLVFKAGVVVEFDLRAGD